MGGTSVYGFYFSNALFSFRSHTMRVFCVSSNKGVIAPENNYFIQEKLHCIYKHEKDIYIA